MKGHNIFILMQRMKFIGCGKLWYNINYYFNIFYILFLENVYFDSRGFFCNIKCIYYGTRNNYKKKIKQHTSFNQYVTKMLTNMYQYVIMLLSYMSGHTPYACIQRIQVYFPQINIRNPFQTKLNSPLRGDTKSSLNTYQNEH